MATTSNPGGRKPTSTTRKTTKTTTRKPAARSTRSSAPARKTTTTTRKPATTQTKTPVAQAQVLAERAFLVPVGVSLVARDNLVSGVRDLATKYGTRTSIEREIKR
jgi:hypothetical protein